MGDKQAQLSSDNIRSYVFVLAVNPNIPASYSLSSYRRIAALFRLLATLCLTPNANSSASRSLHCTQPIIQNELLRLHLPLGMITSLCVRVPLLQTYILRYQLSQAASWGETNQAHLNYRTLRRLSVFIPITDIDVGC